MRWYRTQAWEAPIKESLAASLVLLSDWKFKEPFYDAFCGSWTIAIEALMIAKNIAPWLNRDFAYQKLWLIQSEITENEIALAKTKIFNWNYKIFASDINLDMIKISIQNAKNIWLDWLINFEVKDFNQLLSKNINWTMVSNPPYWNRLKDENLKSIYNNIDKLFRLNKNLNWWLISSYMEFDNIIKKTEYKKRKLYNGSEKCYFWKKIKY
jgi:putative N6-adenine-specific DNA methylase